MIKHINNQVLIFENYIKNDSSENAKKIKRKIEEAKELIEKLLQ